MNIEEVKVSLKTLDQNIELFDWLLDKLFIYHFENKINVKELFDIDMSLWEDIICSDGDLDMVENWREEDDKDETYHKYVKLLKEGKLQYNHFDYYYRCVYVGDGEKEHFIEVYDKVYKLETYEEVKIYIKNLFDGVEFSDIDLKLIYIHLISNYYIM